MAAVVPARFVHRANALTREAVMTAPAPSNSSELRAVLRAVKLGRCLDTLAERLVLANQRNLAHAALFEIVLSD